MMFKLLLDPCVYYPDGQVAPKLPFSLSPTQVGGAVDFFPNLIGNCVGGALSGAVDELVWGVVFMSVASAKDVGIAAMVGCFTGGGGGGGGDGPGGGGNGSNDISPDDASNIDAVKLNRNWANKLQRYLPTEGYKDIHDLKEQFMGGDGDLYNLFFDKGTGEIMIFRDPTGGPGPVGEGQRTGIFRRDIE